MIKTCKLKFKRINKKPVFLERADIILQREIYLNNIKIFREENEAKKKFQGFHVMGACCNSLFICMVLFMYGYIF